MTLSIGYVQIVQMKGQQMSKLEPPVKNLVQLQLQPLLVGFESVFPTDSCTIPGDNGCFQSDDMYLCALIDKRFGDFVRFQILKPYIWKDLVDGSYNSYGLVK